MYSFDSANATLLAMDWEAIVNIIMYAILGFTITHYAPHWTGAFQSSHCVSGAFFGTSGRSYFSHLGCSSNFGNLAGTRSLKTKFKFMTIYDLSKPQWCLYSMVEPILGMYLP